MTDDVVATDRDVEAFTRFLKRLPHGGDVDLVILKAHLLIEEQIRQLVAEHVRNPEALRVADLNTGQAISLAQSFFPPDHDPPLWASLRKLNKLRNEIAHNIEPKGLQDRIADFIGSFPCGWPHEVQGQDLFELTLWSLFASVAGLVEKPSAAVLEFIPGRSR